MLIVFSNNAWFYLGGYVDTHIIRCRKSYINPLHVALVGVCN